MLIPCIAYTTSITRWFHWHPNYWPWDNSGRGPTIYFLQLLTLFQHLLFLAISNAPIFSPQTSIFIYRQFCLSYCLILNMIYLFLTNIRTLVHHVVNYLSFLQYLILLINILVLSCILMYFQYMRYLHKNIMFSKLKTNLINKNSSDLKIVGIMIVWMMYITYLINAINELKLRNERSTPQANFKTKLFHSSSSANQSWILEAALNLMTGQIKIMSQNAWNMFAIIRMIGSTSPQGSLRLPKFKHLELFCNGKIIWLL